MLYITQLIYIREGQESVFHQFEDVAIPIISKYNGRLLLRASQAKKHMSKPTSKSHTKYTWSNLIAHWILKIS